ncbi:hypothetical protein AAG570_014083 [Ranatra chinensis]|uniref:Uncharacterized protein n=1 Tax=Ranatra chinensis TaxID=642074 RepID=A0ABD0XS17_9HEMI
MASKRRNMLYENKKQETTEIGQYVPSRAACGRQREQSWGIQRLLAVCRGAFECDMFKNCCGCRSSPVLERDPPPPHKTSGEADDKTEVCNGKKMTDDKIEACDGRTGACHGEGSTEDAKEDATEGEPGGGTTQTVDDRDKTDDEAGGVLQRRKEKGRAVGGDLQVDLSGARTEEAEGGGSDDSEDEGGEVEDHRGGMTEPPVTPVGRDELALRRHRFFTDLMTASQEMHRVRFDPRGPSFSVKPIYPQSRQAEDGVQAPKHVLLEQEAGGDGNRIVEDGDWPKQVRADELRSKDDSSL